MTFMNNRQAVGFSWIGITMALAITISGCAAPPAVQETEEPVDYVWPAPPDPPRIRYIESLSSLEQDEEHTLEARDSRRRQRNTDRVERPGVHRRGGQDGSRCGESSQSRCDRMRRFALRSPMSLTALMGMPLRYARLRPCAGESFEVTGP